MPSEESVEFLSTRFIVGDRIRMYLEKGTIIELTIKYIAKCSGTCKERCSSGGYMVQDADSRMHCLDKITRLEKAATINSITEI